MDPVGASIRFTLVSRHSEACSACLLKAAENPGPQRTATWRPKVERKIHKLRPRGSDPKARRTTRHPRVMDPRASEKLATGSEDHQVSCWIP